MSPYLTAKTSHRCTYAGCRKPCSKTSVLCERHRRGAAARQAKWRARAAGLLDGRWLFQRAPRFVTRNADLDRSSRV